MNRIINQIAGLFCSSLSFAEIHWNGYYFVLNTSEPCFFGSKFKKAVDTIDKSFTEYQTDLLHLFVLFFFHRKWLRPDVPINQLAGKVCLIFTHFHVSFEVLKIISFLQLRW